MSENQSNKKKDEKMKQNKAKKSLLDRIPHPLALLFYIIIFAAILTYIIPSGEFDRVVMESNIGTVTKTIPGTYHAIEKNPVGIFDILRAIPEGFVGIADIVFIVFAAAMMFGVLEKTGMLENTIGSFVKKIGRERKFLIVAIVTYVYGLLGIFVGYENNIALVPIAVVLALAIGGDVLLGAGIAVGGISVGFGLAPFNPYTVGIGHKIAEMPLFSGWPYRLVIVFILLTILVFFNIRYFKRILENKDKSLVQEVDTTGLTLSKDLSQYSMSMQDVIMALVFLVGLVIMLWGVFTKGWYIKEIAAVFLGVGIISGLAAKMKPDEISETFSKALEPSALAAIIIGLAQAIKVVMDQGGISDTIANALVANLDKLPTMVAVVYMSITQSIINLFIPGGSGQALVTLPIMIPAGDMLGFTRQTTILAFQIGDGLTNIMTPTLGGLMAMLGLCRVPFGKWVRYIASYTAVAFIISWIFLVISVLIGYGPI
ncbi:MAG: YfcC family protein [Tissierellales bacterium]|nr:YfcC family protein [Tissierellales bacterium]MBN2826619.1 YfcC family protein [Tissierellales bacterium]